MDPGTGIKRPCYLRLDLRIRTPFWEAASSAQHGQCDFTERTFTQRELPLAWETARSAPRISAARQKWLGDSQKPGRFGVSDAC